MNRRCQSSLTARELALVLCFAGLSMAAQAQSPDEFFKGKTITIYGGYAASGSYDYYSRTFAQFIDK